MIRLREIRIDDKEMVRQWRNQPSVAKYMYTDHQISSTEHETWFNHVMSDLNSRYWIIMCDGDDVGLANIYYIDRKNLRCYWAFYIASPDTRGKGVGSFVEYFVLNYVFEELKFNKLCCEVLAFNPAVIKMHKKFGFQEEGLFRNHIVKSGVEVDVVAMAILKHEWEGIRSSLYERLRRKGLLT